MKQLVYLGLAVLLAILCVAAFLLRHDGGINLDSLVYARNAALLPGVPDNIFPIGYPAFLRLFHSLTEDFFWAGKAINLACLLVIFAFSYFCRFFFFETVLLFCTKVGMGLFAYTFSEPLFITVLYFQTYLVYTFFRSHPAGVTHQAAIVLLGLALLLVRHTGVFVVAGMGAFWLFLLMTNRPGFVARKWLNVLFFSVLLTVFCMAANYLHFHSFFGEANRGNPALEDLNALIHHFFTNLLGVFNLFNPAMSVAFFLLGSAALRYAFLLADLVFVAGFAWWLWRQLPKQDIFVKYLILMGFCYLGLIFFATFRAGVETLHTRLLAPAIFFLYFAVLISFSGKIRTRPFQAAAVGLLCVLLNFGHLVKNPCNYLAVRRAAMHMLEKKPDARYFFVDEDDAPVSTYRNPFTGSELRYVHKTMQSSVKNRYALFIIHPFLEERSQLPVAENQRTIFNSEIEQAMKDLKSVP